ncbi:MAG: DUF1837 domain-containing protein [Gemmatimonadetes bacterium]|nr:DUF1837 domain-containing protein [Gemmatimonadota bacterium]
MQAPDYELLNMPSAPDELLNAIKGNYVGLDARIRTVPYDWREDDLQVAGSFHYLAFRDGQPTEDEFVNFIYWKIVPFCIPRKERRKKWELAEATHDERYMHELTDQARHLFIKARAKAKAKAEREGREAQSTTGEPGELILFILLEGILKAPQIACKMYLKTSEDMPVHGSDSVHLARGSTPGSVRVIWGESKLYQQFASALDEICSSIAGFLSEAEGRTNRDRDIDVLKDHMDVDDDEWREAMIKYFDPYEDQSNFREESYACFVGFDYSGFGTIEQLPPNEREAAFVSAYQGRIASACTLFAGKLRASGLSRLRIDFFLIPFTSVDTLRAKFLTRLGLPYDQ